MKLLREVSQLKSRPMQELPEERALQRHLASSFTDRAQIDWSDEAQRREQVGELVAEARRALELSQNSLRGYARDAHESSGAGEAGQLLSELLVQDIEEQPETDLQPHFRVRHPAPRRYHPHPTCARSSAG